VPSTPSSAKTSVHDWTAIDSRLGKTMIVRACSYIRFSGCQMTSRRLIKLLALVTMLVLSSLTCGAAAPDWKLYRNAPTGLTFRYPPSMHVVEDDPRRWALSATDALVRLVDARGGLVLTFELNHGNDRLTSIGSECKPMRLGGEEAAFECVECIPACFWSVEVVTPRSCSIGGGPPPLEDADLPLRSIIETVHFEDNARLSGLTNSQELKPAGNASGASIFVTNYNTQKARYSSNGNVLTAYSLASNGNVAPLLAKKVFDNPRGIALDPRGRIVVANQGSSFQGWTSIDVYPPDTKADTRPVATITGATRSGAPDVTGLYSPNGIALDSEGNIFVTIDYGTLTGPHSNRSDSVNVYPAGSNGNVKPSAMIFGPDTGLRDPYGIAVDARGMIYVTNFQGGPSATGSVTMYRADSNGNAKPIRTIAGPDTGLDDPGGIAVDCRGYIYVANYEGGASQFGSITVYAPDSDGDAKPSSTIVGVETGLQQPYGVALDADRNVYVANYMGGASRSGSITVYHAGDNGNVAPNTTIAGPATGLDYPWAIATRPYQCTGQRSPSQQ